MKLSYHYVAPLPANETDDEGIKISTEEHHSHPGLKRAFGYVLSGDVKDIYHTITGGTERVSKIGNEDASPEVGSSYGADFFRGRHSKSAYIADL